MSLFKIDNRTLRLLGAQVNLSETFNHVLRSTPQRDVLPFRLQVDREPTRTAFTIEIGCERHSVVLHNDKKTHLKLADFIEEIANGPFLVRSTRDAADPTRQPPVRVLHLRAAPGI